MGRRSVVIVLALLLGFSGALLLGASGARAHPGGAAARAIVCPLTGTTAAAATVTTPCCGPPVAQTQARAAACCTVACCPATTASAGARPAAVAVCCPAATTTTTTTTTACPITGGLTISASPNPSQAGHAVTITGADSGAAGATVTLWEQTPPATTFSQVATTTASATGAYTFVRAAGSVQTDRSWYVTADGAQSTTIVQQVAASVTFTSASAKVATGRSVSLTGTVTPAHAGETVLLLQRAGSDWNVVGKATLGAHSSYTLHHRFRRAGTVRLRVELPADSRNVQSFSAVRSLRVAG